MGRQAKPRSPRLVSSGRKHCPRCGKIKNIDEDFGWRYMQGYLREQSQCKKCRGLPPIKEMVKKTAKPKPKTKAKAKAPAKTKPKPKAVKSTAKVIPIKRKQTAAKKTAKLIEGL